jgi:hypothetical protein
MPAVADGLGDDAVLASWLKEESQVAGFGRDLGQRLGGGTGRLDAQPDLVPAPGLEGHRHAAGPGDFRLGDVRSWAHMYDEFTAVTDRSRTSLSIVIR